MPVLGTTLKHTKDEDTLYQMALGLEEVVATGLVESNALLALADLLIEHLHLYSRKDYDEIWTGLIIKILEAHGPATYFE